MSDYDRGFYNRKGNNNLRIFLLIAMVGLAYYAGNMYTQTFFHTSLFDAIMNIKW